MRRYSEMAEPAKIKQLILLPLFFQILIAVSIAANKYPFDNAHAESLKNMDDTGKSLRFAGTKAICNEDQPHTLTIKVANSEGSSKAIVFQVTGEKKFSIDPIINGNELKGPFSLENILLTFEEKKAEIVLTLYNKDKKTITFSGRLFTQSDDVGENFGEYPIVQDPITIPQIESLMHTGSAEGTMEWVKALIKNPPSANWYNKFLNILYFNTRPMITTKQATSKLFQLISEKGHK